MKRFVCCMLTAFALIFTMSGCQSEELLKSPFMMEVYPTYMNGAPLHSYPDKVFKNDELFNLLNEGNGEKPFNVGTEGITYSIEMTNGMDYTTFEIWNDGTVVMYYNFFFSSEYYLTQPQYDELVNLLES